MKTTKIIVTPSLYVFAFELQQAIQEGWEIDGECPPAAWGLVYECGLMREVDENAPQKMSRSDILAKARAARAAKRVDGAMG